MHAARLPGLLGARARTFLLCVQVIIWALPNIGTDLKEYAALDTLATFVAYGVDSCSTVLWLSSSVLVTGNEDNSIIKLWHLADTAVCLQSLTFTDTKQPSTASFFNHMDVQTDTGLVILANSRQLAVYTLHVQGTGSSARFDYLAEFSVSQPIMSFTVQYNPSESPAALHLYCTQPMAIQNYTLDPALCCPSGLPAAISLPSTQPAAPTTEQQPITAAEPPPASQQALQPPPSSGFLSGQHSPSLSSQQQPPPIRTLPQPPSPAGPTEQPRLLTPTHLMQQAKRSASQSSVTSLLSQRTPRSATPSVLDNLDAVSTASTQGSKLPAGSLSRQQSADTIPSSAAALDASVSASYESPTASLAGSRANTPPPSMPALPSAAYLTPEQYDPHRDASEALQSTDSQSDLSLDLVNKPGTSDQVSVKLLSRDHDSASRPDQARAPAPSAVFSQPLDLLPVVNAAQPAHLSLLEPVTSTDGDQSQQGPATASVDSSAGLVGGSSELSDTSVKRIADAVAERTLAQHKRVLSYLNDGHREMLRIIKGDISKEGKRLQLAFDAQVS